MILKVHVSDWELEENDWVLRIGDEVSFWLFFAEAGRWPTTPPERMKDIRGQVRSVPDWEGQEARRHPVWIDVGPAALYWDAPEAVQGAVQLVGEIRRNAVDAPAHFPATRGIVRRIRMEWRDRVQYRPREWRTANDRARYDDVPASHIPLTDFDPRARTTTAWAGVLLDLEVIGTDATWP